MNIRRLTSQIPSKCGEELSLRIPLVPDDVPGIRDEDFKRVTIPDIVEMAGETLPLENRLSGLGLLLENLLSGLAARFIDAESRETESIYILSVNILNVDTLIQCYGCFWFLD
jgi:hypothetical protein